MVQRGGSDDGGGAGAGPGPETGGAPETETEETSTGLDAALDRLRAAFGDDVVTLWRASGPRKGHVAEVACVLAEIGDYPRKLIVQVHKSGTFKLFAEVAGKDPDAMINAVTEQFAPS